MTKKAASYWARKAKVAIKEGYSPGNIYERRLKRQIKEIKPELFQGRRDHLAW